jgi:hypothetical protein
MTEEQFESGYGYATELRDFARELGIRSAAKRRISSVARRGRSIRR